MLMLPPCERRTWCYKLQPSSNLEFAGSSQVSSARVQSAQSSAPPSVRSLAVPNMAKRTPGEQAVIQALQAVANYPESRNLVKTVSRSLPGLQTLLDASVQPEGCMSTRTSQGQGPSTTTQRAVSPISMLSPVSDEEPGRQKISPHELAGAASTSDIPSTRPPSDKRNNTPRSVVIPDPPKVGFRGVLKPQMFMSEVIERYAPSPSSVLEGTATATSSSSASASRTTSKVPPYYTPSEDVTGYLVTRDANRTWQIAPRLSERQFRDRQRVPPPQR